MTTAGESLYPEDWLRIARQDWRRVHVLLDDEDADGVGLQAPVPPRLQKGIRHNFPKLS